ncbi:hypothetical protein Taro_022574, partial [Colocasia esculenta]|nr:hypothetical protein [Colocasia esculenta]
LALPLPPPGLPPLLTALPFHKAPSDIYRIWKHGASVRADTSLVGFDRLYAVCAEQSFLFLGSSDEDGGKALPFNPNPRAEPFPFLLAVLNHAWKEIYDAFEEVNSQVTAVKEDEFMADISIHGVHLQTDTRISGGGGREGTSTSNGAAPRRNRVGEGEGDAEEHAIVGAADEGVPTTGGGSGGGAGRAGKQCEGGAGAAHNQVLMGTTMKQLTDRVPTPWNETRNG